MRFRHRTAGGRLSGAGSAARRSTAQPKLACITTPTTNAAVVVSTSRPEARAKLPTSVEARSLDVKFGDQSRFIGDAANNVRAAVVKIQVFAPE